jgi:transposase, IS5 family
MRKEKRYKTRIHRRAARNHSLSLAPTGCQHHAREDARSRGTVFADQRNAMGGKIVRTIGIGLARVKIGMINLVYNMRRLVQLARMAAASA